MSESGSERDPTFLALLQPLGAGIGAVFAFGILIVATRQGQFASIASFGAGAGAAALTSVAVGGGTTLAYTTGSVLRQHAVRVVRSTIVLPTILVTTIVAALLYSALGELDLLSLVAGGISTGASVSAELDASYLRRHLKTWQLFAADTLNRLVAFGLVLLGIPFAFSMATGSIFRAVWLRLATGTDPSRKGGMRIRRSGLALAYETKLTSLSILYSIGDRLASLTAPTIAPVSVSGGLMAVLSAQQNVSGVLLTGLQTTLAARSQKRSPLSWANRLDVILFIAGLSAALIMIVWQEPLVLFLGLARLSNPEDYWVAIALLIPASLGSRLFEFRFLTMDASYMAVFARLLAVIVGMSATVAALITARITLLANGLLLAEVVSVLTSLGLLLVRHLRAGKGPSNAA